MRAFDDVKYVLLAGGGVNMSAAGWTEEQLQRLALVAAGSSKSPTLTLRDTDHLTAIKCEESHWRGMGASFSFLGDHDPRSSITNDAKVWELKDDVASSFICSNQTNRPT
jgi:hypothetical protein